MRLMLVCMLISAWTVGLAYADEVMEGIVVKPHQAVVQAKGVNCSFCAYGVQKNLSKLKFVDAAQFRKGVLLDIHAGRITLALAPDKPLNLKEIHTAIVKGGYDPVTVYLRLRGRVESQGGRSFLTASDTGQLFELSWKGPKPLPTQGVVEVQAHLAADQIPSLPDGQPIPIAVDQWEKAS